jgi:hypothetical protein
VEKAPLPSFQLGTINAQPEYFTGSQSLDISVDGGA